MADITFRGISANSLGLIVEKMPDAVRAKKRAKKVPVIGRSGDLWEDEPGYDGIKLQVKLNMFARGTLDAVNEWLAGSGDLILSDDPTRCYRAHIIDEVKMARRRTANGENYDTITVSFDCMPYRYQVNVKPISLTEPEPILNPGNVEAYPIITVSGNGAGILMVNGKALQISDLSGGIVINSEDQIAYSPSDIKLLRTSRLTGEFPVLGIGYSPVSFTGGITKIEIVPNWAWL